MGNIASKLGYLNLNKIPHIPYLKRYEKYHFMCLVIQACAYQYMYNYVV